MLSKKHRLTKREDFSITYSQGSYANYDGIAIKYAKTGQPETRVGFPVGKNFSKKAAERNRARRILQAACQVHVLSLKQGFNIIVMPQPGNKELEFKKAVVALEQVFIKANLFI